MKRTERSPVSFEASVARLPKKGMPLKLEADSAQREALAREHDLSAVERFEADLLVTPWKRDGVKIVGSVRADIIQACVVTLEPIPSHVDEDVESVFLPEGSRLARPDRLEAGEMVLDAEGPDAPELFSGDTIDVGQLAEEFFALGVDPYPRKPGAEIETGRQEEAPRGPLYEKLRGLTGKR